MGVRLHARHFSDSVSLVSEYIGKSTITLSILTIDLALFQMLRWTKRAAFLNDRSSYAIKHKVCLSDDETVKQIREDPYLQYIVGLPGYQMQAPFAPSLFVEIRQRVGQSVFAVLQSAVIDVVESTKPK